MTVKYVVYGKVRGVISHHHLLGAAVRSRDKDRRACKRQGAGCYSDAVVHAYDPPRTMAGLGPVVSHEELEAKGFTGVRTLGLPLHKAGASGSDLVECLYYGRRPVALLAHDGVLGRLWIPQMVEARRNIETALQERGGKANTV